MDAIEILEQTACLSVSVGGGRSVWRAVDVVLEVLFVVVAVQIEIMIVLIVVRIVGVMVVLVIVGMCVNMLGVVGVDFLIVLVSVGMGIMVVLRVKFRIMVMCVPMVLACVLSDMSLFRHSVFEVVPIIILDVWLPCHVTLVVSLLRGHVALIVFIVLLFLDLVMWLQRLNHVVIGTCHGLLRGPSGWGEISCGRGEW